MRIQTADPVTLTEEKGQYDMLPCLVALLGGELNHTLDVKSGSTIELRFAAQLTEGSP